MRLLAASALFLVACATEAPIPIYGEVPPFQLTSQAGEPLGRNDLEGSIWVADFIFTHCTGPCPRMSSRMKQVQAATNGLNGVRLVSFSVDPENDTPDALAAYAKRYGAASGRWTFLTGPKETLNQLSMDTFMLGKVDGQQMDHSTRFVLVDSRGRVRKYYTTTEGFHIPDLVRDVKLLLKETS